MTTEHQSHQPEPSATAPAQEVQKGLPPLPAQLASPSPLLNRFGLPASAALQQGNASANGLKKVNYNHDAMIDLILASQGRITRTELATHFGLSESWVSRVLNSDAFQARLAVRKSDLVDPLVAMTIEEKFKLLINDSLDIFTEKLQKTKSADLAMKGIEMGAKALGYGARQQNLNVQANFVVAMPGKVDSADAWAQKHASGGGASGQVVDAQPKSLDERLQEAEGRQGNEG